MRWGTSTFPDEKRKGGEDGIYHSYIGLTPSERVYVRAVVPISTDFVLFQDGVDLVKFLGTQRDVHGSEIFQDPRLVRGTGDGDDVRTCTEQSQTSD